MPTDLSNECHAGYDAHKQGGVTEAPYLATSPAWLAWKCGKYLAGHKRPRPRQVRASRGDDMRVDGVIWTPITASRELWRRK